jgi:hypothetical protein
MSIERKIVVPEAPPVGAAICMDSDRSGSNPKQIKVDVPESAELKKGTSNDAEVPSSKMAGDGIVGGQTKLSGESGRNSASGKIEAEKQSKDTVMVLVIGLVGALLIWALVSESNRQEKKVEPPSIKNVARSEASAVADKIQPQVMSQVIASASDDQKTKTVPERNATALEPALKPREPYIYAPPPVSEFRSTKSVDALRANMPPISPIKTEIRPPSQIVAQLKVINVDRDDTLSVRRAPSAASDRVGRIPSNTRGIGLLSLNGRKNGRDTWYQIWWHGVTGWVNGSFVDYE